MPGAPDRLQKKTESKIALRLSYSALTSQVALVAPLKNKYRMLPDAISMSLSHVENVDMQEA